MCGFLRPPFSATPKASTYCDQFVTSVGSLTGPDGANPTNAAIAVPTPSIGLGPLLTSSTYTPGDRYSAIFDAPSVSSARHGTDASLLAHLLTHSGRCRTNRSEPETPRSGRSCRREARST